jgi:hypothetical protein
LRECEARSNPQQTAVCGIAGVRSTEQSAADRSLCFTDVIAYNYSILLISGE